MVLKDKVSLPPINLSYSYLVAPKLLLNSYESQPVKRNTQNQYYQLRNPVISR